MSVAIEVIDDPARAQAALHPARRALLEALDQPLSAAALARRLELPRQRVNYHLRELEAQSLVSLEEERRRGSCIERVYRRSAEAYAVSPAALGSLESDPEEIEDQLSAGLPDRLGLARTRRSRTARTRRSGSG